MASRPTISFTLAGSTGLTAYSVDGADSAMQSVGRGGASSVYSYQVPGRERVAIKIFYKPDRIPWGKLELMARENTPPAGAAPPAGASGYTIGWPLAPVFSGTTPIGIVLPFFDSRRWRPLDNWIEFHLLAKLSANSASLGYRLNILRNLAAALAELHRRDMAVVDLKPANILVDQERCIVSLIDVDSYRVVRAGKTYPATHVSPGYILPTALGDTIDIASLGQEQDRYALAVLIFQLLNFGIHPFQGILTAANDEASTNDEKAKRKLYACGRTPSPAIRPLPQSVHDCWPHQARVMLEVALTQVDQAPTAQTWADHFGSILDRKELERCSFFPQDVRHIRFEAMPCMTCKRIDAAQKVQAEQARIASQKPTKPNPRIVQPTGAQQQTATQVPPVPANRNWMSWGIWRVLGVLAVPAAIVAFHQLGNDTSSHQERVTKAPVAINRWATVTNGSLNLYSGPGSQYQIVITMNSGNVVKVLYETNTSWDEIEVSYIDAQKNTKTYHGYASSLYLQYK